MFRAGNRLSISYHKIKIKRKVFREKDQEILATEDLLADGDRESVSTII
jgi:hypothetical protein